MHTTCGISPEGLETMKSWMQIAGMQRRFICCWTKRSRRTPLPFASVAICKGNILHVHFASASIWKGNKKLNHWFYMSDLTVCISDEILLWGATVYSTPGEDPGWESPDTHKRGPRDDLWLTLPLRSRLANCLPHSCSSQIPFLGSCSTFNPRHTTNNWLEVTGTKARTRLRMTRA